MIDNAGAPHRRADRLTPRAGTRATAGRGGPASTAASWAMPDQNLVSGKLHAGPIILWKPGLGGAVMSETYAEVDRRFGIADLAHVVEGQGGLPKVRITSPEVAAEMYLHGAHVTSWKPTGTEEVFFVSRQSRWEHGRAIRGGVPVCFPWFGNNVDNPHLPAHEIGR